MAADILPMWDTNKLGQRLQGLSAKCLRIEPQLFKPQIKCLAGHIFLDAKNAAVTAK